MYRGKLDHIEPLYDKKGKLIDCLFYFEGDKEGYRAGEYSVHSVVRNSMEQVECLISTINGDK